MAAKKKPCPDHPELDMEPDNELNDNADARRGARHINKTWCDGKKIYQLNPTNPDYVVTSEKQMVEAYERNGLSMDTGGYKSTEDSNYAALHHKAASKLKHERSEQK
jgi:hypothetical protein